MRRLVEGMAAWLTFKQAAAARTLYCEHFLYPPLYEIGSGRGWKVLAQVPVTKTVPKSGAPETLDFVFFKRATQSTSEAAIMVEVKFLRGENSAQELSALYSDFVKLRKISLKQMNNVTLNRLTCIPGKWQIVIAQRSAYEKISETKSKTRKNIVAMLNNVRDEKLKSVYKSVIETKLKNKFHWHVFAIGEPIWPK